MKKNTKITPGKSGYTGNSSYTSPLRNTYNSSYNSPPKNTNNSSYKSPSKNNSNSSYRSPSKNNSSSYKSPPKYNSNSSYRSPSKNNRYEISDKELEEKRKLSNINKIVVKDLPLDITYTEILNIFKGLGEFQFNLPSIEIRLNAGKNTQSVFPKFDSEQSYNKALKMDGAIINRETLNNTNPIQGDIKLRIESLLPKKELLILKGKYLTGKYAKENQRTDDENKVRNFNFIIDQMTPNSFNVMKDKIKESLNNEDDTNIIKGYEDIIFRKVLTFQDTLYDLIIDICLYIYQFNPSFIFDIINNVKLFMDNKITTNITDNYNIKILKNNCVKFIKTMFINDIISYNDYSEYIDSFVNKINMNDINVDIITYIIILLFNSLNKMYIFGKEDIINKYYKFLENIYNIENNKINRRNKLRFDIEDILTIMDNILNGIEPDNKIKFESTEINNTSETSIYDKIPVIQNLFEEYFEQSDEDISMYLNDDFIPYLKDNFTEDEYIDLYSIALLEFKSDIDSIIKIISLVNSYNPFNFNKNDIINIVDDLLKSYSNRDISYKNVGIIIYNIILYMKNYFTLEDYDKYANEKSVESLMTTDVFDYVDNLLNKPKNISLTNEELEESEIISQSQNTNIISQSPNVSQNVGTNKQSTLQIINYYQSSESVIHTKQNIILESENIEISDDPNKSSDIISGIESTSTAGPRIMDQEIQSPIMKNPKTKYEIIKELRELINNDNNNNKIGGFILLTKK